MKKAIKVTLIVLGSLILLLIVAALVLPVIFKPQILEFAQKKASESLKADVTLRDLNISFFKSFPRLNLSVEGVSVVNREPFAGDTLAALDELSLAVNLKSLLDLENMEIYSIHLARPRLLAQRDTLGNASWDITYPSTDTVAQEQPADTATPSKIGIKLRELTIMNARVEYRDDSSRMRALADSLNFTLHGDLGLDRSIIDLALRIGKVRFENGGLPLVPGWRLGFDAKVDANLDSMRFVLQDNQLTINDLVLQFGGWLSMPGEDIDMDMKFNTLQTDFKTLLSLVPAMYNDLFADIQTRGSLTLNGWAKGVYNANRLPDAHVELAVKDAYFKYPALPKSVDDIQIDAKVDMKGEDMNSLLFDLPKLHAAIAGNSLDVVANARNLLKDPHVRAKANGRVDLASIGQVVPLDSMDLSGLLALNVLLEASQSQVEALDLDKCTLEGSIELTKAKVEGVLSKPLQIERLAMQLSPQRIAIPALNARAGRTDLSLQGGVRNFLPYLFTDKGILEGEMQLASRRIDLNELFPSVNEEPAEEATPAPTQTDTVAVIDSSDGLGAARRIEFTFRSAIDSLYFQNIKASAVKGNFRLSQGVLTLDQIGARALGGSMNVSGDVDFRQEKATKLNLNAQLQQVEILQCIRTFTSIEKMVPPVKYMRGNISMGLKAKGLLGEGFSPDLSSLMADGNVATSALQLEGSPLLKKLGGVLKNDIVNNPTLNALKVLFEVKEGRVHFKPFNTSLKGIATQMQGSVGLDQTVNYTMKLKVPSSLLGKGSEVLSNALSKFGGNAQLAEQIPVDVLVGGTVTDPKLSVKIGDNLKGQVKAAVAAKVEEVKEKAQEKIDEALQRAEAEAAKIRANARQQGDKILADAQAKADQLVEEAKKKGPLAGAAAKKAADKIMSDARAKVSQIQAEADRKADDLVATAKAKSKI